MNQSKEMRGEAGQDSGGHCPPMLHLLHKDEGMERGVVDEEDGSELS